MRVTYLFLYFDFLLCLSLINDLLEYREKKSIRHSEEYIRPWIVLSYIGKALTNNLQVT